MNEINNILNDIDIYIKENKINVLIGFSQGGNVVLFENDIKCAIIYSGYTFPKLVNYLYFILLLKMMKLFLLIMKI